MVQISLQNSGGKVVFYGWVPRNPPLGTNGSKSTLVSGHLSVKIINIKQQQKKNYLGANYLRNWKFLLKF